MFTQMRNRTDQVTRSTARGTDTLSVATGDMLTSEVTFANTAATTAWNVKPCVHPTAICTHGKPYARRLQEILT